MIITCTKQGRTGRDAANLVAHLLKPDNLFCLVRIGNSIAADLNALVREMRILRDASTSSDTTCSYRRVD